MENLNSTVSINLSIDDFAPDPFSLSLPLNETETTNVSPLLNWSASLDTHFKNYTIVIDDSQAFTSPNYVFANIENISNTTLPLAINLTMNTAWFWKVVAYDILGNERNSTQTFVYITDNSTPNVTLRAPLNSTVITNASLVQFVYAVNETNTVQNCSIYVNDVIQSTTTSPPTIEKNFSNLFEVALSNGAYNWSVECFDKAGNRNLSAIQYFNVSVPIPVTKWINAFGGTTAPGTVNVNLSTTNDGLENSFAVTIGGTPAIVTNATTPLGTGGNGIFIPSRSAIIFGATASTTAGASTGFISWQLFAVNSTDQLLISQYGNISLGGVQMTTASKANWTATGNLTPAYDIYIPPTSNLSLKVWMRYTGGGSRSFTDYWEGSSETFVNITAYNIGFIQVNLTQPPFASSYTINSTFNATCNVSCTSGVCLATEVTLEMNTSSSGWIAVNQTSGNMVLNGTAQSNPVQLGTINSTSRLINFTVLTNQVSSLNHLRCLAGSTHSTMNGTNAPQINITSSNVVPIVESISIMAINDLSAGIASRIYCNATVSDSNGLNDFSNVNATLYHNLTSTMSEEDNLNRHYTNASCTNTSATATTKTFACGFDIYYFASNGTWWCNVSVNDTTGASSFMNVTTFISDLLALNVTDTIDYGVLNPGTNSTSDFIANVSNIGNIQLDMSLWGYAVNYSTGDNLSMDCEVGNISIENERYNLTTSGQNHAQMHNLSGTPQGSYHDMFNLVKATAIAGSTQQTYWKLAIPTNVRGLCNGTVVFNAIKG